MDKNLAKQSPWQRTPFNQTPALVDYNTVSSDKALLDAIQANAGEHSQQVTESLVPLGELAGSEEARQHGARANNNEPVLKTVDRHGYRVDEVEFDPSWHWTMSKAVGFGLGGTAWTEKSPVAHLRRAAGMYAWGQNDQGHMCPVGMTYAAVPSLYLDSAIAQEWVGGLASTEYDPGLRIPSEKKGILAGMAMTEKQGGSDLRNSSSIARPTSEPGMYLIDGHKWFTSAPMNDVFLTLAQTPEGISCFVVPRVLPDGNRNPIEIVRLKNKMGNRSNASSELEFRNTHGRLLGEPGRGVKAIIEMVNVSRLETILQSLSVMRKSLSEAIWHTTHRSAFGAKLSEKPAMQNVLADLAIEMEAAVFSTMRLASTFDRSGDSHEEALRRIAMPLLKFWITKRTPYMVAESLECLGGNGFIEESGMPQLFRESPLGSIWEGSGNVNALDTLRAIDREPSCLEAWQVEVESVAGHDERLDNFVRLLSKEVSDAEDREFRARRLVAGMATALQATILIKQGDQKIADLFCATRIDNDWRGAFGTLPGSPKLDDVIQRSMPLLDA